MNKFIQVKEELMLALKELEEVVLAKMNKSQQERGLELSTKINNSNLSQEINILNQSLMELGQENEELIKENKELKLYKNKSQAVINQIKIDLTQIRKIIS